ncbi:MAG: hypothetical protein HY785_21950 [Oscillatoriophycideae cyanobacterium NC_groundwater_1537_Pr4_S-0.65um_50_18]|nr:hypothetical protein [Oscillatoriophycideae cyanobacterium NC_groundwater_1537_Pr4_S-0.65um_50_18]
MTLLPVVGMVALAQASRSDRSRVFQARRAIALIRRIFWRSQNALD